MFPQDKIENWRRGQGQFADVPAELWNDWRWQLRNQIRSREQLEKFLNLSDSERRALEQLSRSRERQPLAITPHFLNLLDRENPADPLRRQVVPAEAEFLRSRDEFLDPLCEENQSPVPALVHRYRDRVLLLATDRCASYCRFCTRARFVGGNGGNAIPENGFSSLGNGDNPVAGSKILQKVELNSGDKIVAVPKRENRVPAGVPANLVPALDYIRSHEEIRDVLISGGDPLLLSDERLDAILSAIRAIDHVEFLRIGTRVPAFLPQRITENLCQIFKKNGPIWLSIHANHPRELTQETAAALEKLAFAGTVFGAQTVLMRGVNDSAGTLKSLFHRLLQIRVRPYYLYACDATFGSAQFRVPVERGRELMRELRAGTTGYALPTFVQDSPHGKMPL